MDKFPNLSKIDFLMECFIAETQFSSTNIKIYLIVWPAWHSSSIQSISGISFKFPNFQKSYALVAQQLAQLFSGDNNQIPFHLGRREIVLKREKI